MSVHPGLLSLGEVVNTSGPAFQRGAESISKTCKKIVRKEAPLSEDFRSFNVTNSENPLTS